MLLLAAVTTLASGCGGSGGGKGESVECIPNGPLLVADVFSRSTDQKTLAVPFNEKPIVWEAEVETWRILTDAPAGATWRQETSGDLYALDPNALYHSVDGDAWDIAGPGLEPRVETGKLLGRSADGTTWAHDYFGTLQRLDPGASAWTPAFTTEAPLVKNAAMAPDGSIWVAVLGDDALIRGLWRVAADGSTIEEVYGCDNPALLFCNLNVSVYAFNAAGDLFYGDRVRAFQRSVKTGVATERAYLREPKYVFADTMAVHGDTIYVIARNQYSGGEGFLLAFDEGSTLDSEPRLIMEAANRNSGIVGHGDNLFVHSPGVCPVDL